MDKEEEDRRPTYGMNRQVFYRNSIWERLLEWIYIYLSLSRSLVLATLSTFLNPNSKFPSQH